MSERKNLRRPSVEVVLLNIDAVIRNPTHGDPTISHILDGPRCIGVRLDTSAIRRVDDLRIRKRHPRHSIVRLATNGANRQSMAATAVHPRDQNVRPGGHSDTVILVVHLDIRKRNRIGARDVEAIRVVRCRVAIAQAVGRVAGAVVQNQPGHGQAGGAGDVEAVRGPVLDVEVRDDCVLDLAHHEEVVRLFLSAV